LEREAVRASDLLANLLDLSRLDRGQRVFDMESRTVAAAVDPCVAEFQQLYPDRADDLVLDGDPDLTVQADASALERCLTNLLDNAGKYTVAGTPVRVVWRTGENGDVLMRVEDDGPGVPLAERKRLFERYARGSRTDGVAGTGLGLSLVKDLVEGMGGTVQYRDDGRGACFEMRLPGATNA
jgi:signal transduction histidine kinase